MGTRSSSHSNHVGRARRGSGELPVPRICPAQTGFPNPSAPLPGIRDVSCAMRAVGDGRLSTRVACPPGDGMADLCQSFNEMAEKLEREMTARRRAEERLADRESRKDTLLREIHHRVKNNLQVVSALLELQTSSLTDPAARQACRESLQRIRTMALIHEGLYRHRDLTQVKMDRYVQQLAAQLLTGYGRGDGTIRVETAVDPSLCLPVGTVTPVGLILNELLSNALKHAFPGRRRGVISVRLDLERDGSLLLSVADDGVGFAPAEPPSSEASMGMRLVSMLTEQLQGALTVKHDGGTTFTLRIPPLPAEPHG